MTDGIKQGAGEFKSGFTRKDVETKIQDNKPNATETKASSAKAEQKDREALVKEGKRVFKEEPVTQVPITNDSVPTVEPETVDVRALQHGKGDQ